MKKHNWTEKDIPDQEGRRIVITGANSGIGLIAAKVMAKKGAAVILAVRNLEKGKAAADNIRREFHQAKLSVMELDLSSLTSVRQFAELFQEKYNSLSVLINNAGIMAIPYSKTTDGFEMQFGTNHLGHFALTGLLLPAIKNSPGARVVTTSSSYHMQGQIDFEHLEGSNGYKENKSSLSMSAYQQSKLANLLFARELQRRFQASGIDAISIGSHPGYTRTKLHLVGPQMRDSRLKETLMKLMYVFAQSPEMGTLPNLYAATSADIRGGEYIGPKGFMGMRGYPGPVPSSQLSQDIDVAQRLWKVSEEMTGVRYL